MVSFQIQRPAEEEKASKVTDPSVMTRIAVLISGGGRTLENLHKHIKAGTLPAEIKVVISSSFNANGANKAMDLGYDLHYITRKQHSDSFAFQSIKIFDVCKEKKVDIVCLAGWLNMLIIPKEFKNRVMNIHPSLLPAFGGRDFYGTKVHEAVLKRGCKWSGCTVHFADDSYDTGPIIAQAVVPVLAKDTPQSLADRVFEEECKLYPMALTAYAEGRIRVDDKKVIIGGIDTPQNVGNPKHPEG